MAPRRRASASPAMASTATAPIPSGRRLPGRTPCTSPSSCVCSAPNVRTNPLMQPIAATLSDEDINDLAVYYSTQTPTGLEADPSYWKAGEQLYRVGDRARNIPACVACHGPAGAGNPAAGYPALRAQHAVYTVKQLNEYASGTRYQPTQDATAKSRNGHDHGHDRAAPHARGHSQSRLLHPGHALNTEFLHVPTARFDRASRRSASPPARASLRPRQPPSAEPASAAASPPHRASHAGTPAEATEISASHRGPGIGWRRQPRKIAATLR